MRNIEIDFSYLNELTDEEVEDLLILDLQYLTKTINKGILNRRTNNREKLVILTLIHDITKQLFKFTEKEIEIFRNNMLTIN